MTRVCVHVGYPKTATTTLQQHLFSRHPEIEYLGKFIPGFGFKTPELGLAMNELISHDDTRYAGTKHLRRLLDPLRRQGQDPTLLISSESMIHPWATDRGVVARRVYEAFSPCRVLVTIREQQDIIKSFYGRHGRFGQYLFLEKYESEKLRSPISFKDWFFYCMRTVDKNFLGTIRYYETIRYYVELFGRDNVGIFLFEEFRSQKSVFLAKLCQFLGVQDVVKAEELVVGKHEFPKLSRMDIFHERVASRLPSWLKRSASPGPLQQYTRFPTRAFGTPTITFDPSHVQQLLQLYGEGNQRLQDDYNVPLKQFGYLMSSESVGTLD